MSSANPLPPLDVDRLRRAVLGAASPWRRVDVVEETGSTNADLVTRAATGEDVDGAVLLAEHQRSGRGRNGRSWSAVPRAQIAMSVGVRAGDVPAEGWGWLPLATGVAVVDALADIGVAAELSVGLKWPNDVLAGRAAGKLAGILAEVAAPRPTIVVGVGLNVSATGDELPTPAATSLLALGVAAPDRDALVRALLGRLGERISAWRRAGGADDALRDDYRARSLTIGSTVRATLPGESEVVGTALSVDAQGRLLIQTGDAVVPIAAGDVAHLRPVDPAPG